MSAFPYFIYLKKWFYFLSPWYDFFYNPSSCTSFFKCDFSLVLTLEKKNPLTIHLRLNARYFRSILSISQYCIKEWILNETKTSKDLNKSKDRLHSSLLGGETSKTMLCKFSPKKFWRCILKISAFWCHTVLMGSPWHTAVLCPGHVLVIWKSRG